MAELIKLGKTPIYKKMDIACGACEAVYRIGRGDIRFFDCGRWYWNYHYTNCPCCGSKQMMLSADVEGLKKVSFV